MNIVYEILRKLSYLKPVEYYDERILNYFLKSSLRDYFNDTDKYEITINIKNNYIEIINLRTNEEYLIEKKENSLDFINKNTNEILFNIINTPDKISLIGTKAIKLIKINEENEQYYIINNNNGNVLVLSDLKVKISNKDYFELKYNNTKTKLIGLSFDNTNKYETIFNY